MAKGFKKIIGETFSELIVIFIAVYAGIYVEKYAPIDNLGKYPLLIIMIVTLFVVLVFRRILNEDK